MPHCLVEYSDNLAADGDIQSLLGKIAAKYAESGGVFPVAGIRVRAARRTEYVIADGQGDHGFVHVTCTITAGRDSRFKARFFGAMFEIVRAHFAALSERRTLGISLEVQESAENTSFKFQNIIRKPA